MELVENPFPLASVEGTDADVVVQDGLDAVSELWVFG